MVNSIQQFLTNGLKDLEKVFSVYAMDLTKIAEMVSAVSDSETKRKAVETAKAYILSYWPAIMNGVRNRKDEIHCSAEGHVSHIFSDRMSSRPLGWSVVGADKMARLRIYKQNGGNMLELVRYQKEKLPEAVGAEEIIYSADEIMKMEREHRKKIGELRRSGEERVCRQSVRQGLPPCAVPKNGRTAALLL